jgi:hypothetical protein
MNLLRNVWPPLHNFFQQSVSEAYSILKFIFGIYVVDVNALARFRPGAAAQRALKGICVFFNGRNGRRAEIVLTRRTNAILVALFNVT